MSPKVMFAVAVAVLGLSAGRAFAESEGGADPFPFRTGLQVVVGQPFAADTGSGAYPQVIGHTTPQSSLARLEPTVGTEALVQTASSLPRGFGNGSVASSQAQSLDRYLAGRQERAFRLEAGAKQPKN